MFFITGLLQTWCWHSRHDKLVGAGIVADYTVTSSSIVVEMLVHVHVLVNAQQHCSCVYRKSP